MPTGTGKTLTFVTLPKEGARTLIIVPFITLVGQTVASIRKFRNCDPDVEQAENEAIPDSQFIVASWQSLHSNDRYKKFIGQVDLVVVDEAHIGFTVECRDVLNAFKKRGARILGCTATAYRSDKQSLLGFYDSIAYAYSMRQAIMDGWLVGPKCSVHYVKSIDLKGLTKRSGNDFPAEELDRILRAEESIHDICALIKNNHVSGTKGIVFAHSVRQAEKLREVITTRYGIPASLVHSYMTKERRYEEMVAFGKGKNELAINVGCLTTGYDNPAVSEIFIAKPTKSLAKYTQMIGRGTRLLPNVVDGCDGVSDRVAAIAKSAKPFFHIHDITDSSRCHQIKTCIDVLAEQSKDLKNKLKRRCEEKPLNIEELDQAVADEIEQERQMKRLEREAEIERRKKLVVGMEFDKDERDLFLDPDRDTPKRKEYRMIFGKYKGQPLRNIKLSYLRWVVDSCKLTPFWHGVFTKHIAFREAVERQDSERGIS